MKVLLLNGSSNLKGCTYTALEEIAKTLQEEGIDTEIFQIGAEPLRDCIGCGGCSKGNGCVFRDDCVNEFVEKAKTYFQKSSYLLEVIEINDWQDELSFESKTGKALFHTIETIKQKNFSLKCYISGYSLAGLFSLYAMHELDLDGAISVSGSLWKEGWLDYLKEHPIYHKKIYLSLGSKEHKTRNVLMKNVLKNTLETYEIYQKENQCFFEKNVGNHFFQSEQRMMKGWDYILYEKQEINREKAIIY